MSRRFQLTECSPADTRLVRICRTKRTETSNAAILTLASRGSAKRMSDTPRVGFGPATNEMPSNVAFPAGWMEARDGAVPAKVAAGTSQLLTWICMLPLVMITGSTVEGSPS